MLPEQPQINSIPSGSYLPPTGHSSGVSLGHSTGHSLGHSSSTILTGHSSSGQVSSSLSFGHDNHFAGPQTSYGPPPSGTVLTPPNGIYGVPPGAKYAGLAIQHGSISGNLKPWPVSGSPPKRPIPFKEPLPQGLIESIGEKVKHIDGLSNGYESSQHLSHSNHHVIGSSNQGNFGNSHGLTSGGVFGQSHGFSSSGSFSQSHGFSSQFGSGSSVDIQQSHDLSGGLYTLPLEQAPKPFFQPGEISQHLQLPLEHTAYHAGQQNDCNHGLPQDSYGPPPSGRQLGASSEISANVVTSYIPPPSGIVGDTHIASASSNSETISELLPEPSSLTDSKSSGSHISSSVSETKSSSSSSSSATADNDKSATEITKSNEKEIAQQTQTSPYVIPVQGKLGSYQLQFQSANALGDPSGHGVDGATHEQLLSEGLLQQILNAIESPHERSNTIVPQTTYDHHIDHQDAADFLNSPTGQETLAEPKVH